MWDFNLHQRAQLIRSLVAKRRANYQWEEGELAELLVCIGWATVAVFLLFLFIEGKEL